MIQTSSVHYLLSLKDGASFFPAHALCASLDGPRNSERDFCAAYITMQKRFHQGQLERKKEN